MLKRVGELESANTKDASKIIVSLLTSMQENETADLTSAGVQASQQDYPEEYKIAQALYQLETLQSDDNKKFDFLRNNLQRILNRVVAVESRQEQQVDRSELDKVIQQLAALRDSVGSGDGESDRASRSLDGLRSTRV